MLLPVEVKRDVRGYVILYKGMAASSESDSSHDSSQLSFSHLHVEHEESCSEDETCRHCGAISVGARRAYCKYVSVNNVAEFILRL